MEEMKYTGISKIYLDFQLPTKVLRIHSKSPVVIQWILFHDSDLLFTPLDFDIIEIFFNTPQIGHVEIEIYFEVPILNTSSGCYFSEQEGQTMINTHFEPIHAREALPILDEPCFKSIFNLSVTVSPEWSVISNMPGTSTVKDSLSTTVFSTTPAMPCYLLHWTVCKHDKISTSLGETAIALYARDTSRCEDFLKLTRDTVEFYNSLLGIQYSLPKLDIISTFSKKLLRIAV